ncbi:hypothetical protein JYT44_03670 [Caldithrix abyssi]|nr:hypothetical protein [Caldithrix abyssi]
MAIKRPSDADLQLLEEKGVISCHALQDKVWVTDPDGNSWEIFYVKVADTAPEQNFDFGSDFVESTCSCED